MKSTVKVLSFLVASVCCLTGYFSNTCTDAAKVTFKERCPTASKRPNKGKEYVIGDARVSSWDNAWNYCISKGWSLASIESKDEENQLLKAVEEAGEEFKFIWLGGRRFGNQHYWMVPQTAHKQEFALVPFTYKNWMPGEPDNRNEIDEDCVAFDTQPLPNRYGWHDIPCQKMNYNFMCEKYLG